MNRLTTFLLCMCLTCPTFAAAPLIAQKKSAVGIIKDAVHDAVESYDSVTLPPHVRIVVASIGS